MRVNLTDITIRNLKAPEKGQRTYLDKNLPGFGVRISQGGTKTYTLMHGPNRELTTIGRVGIITLAQARERGRDILAEEHLGIRRTKAPRFPEAVEQFIARHCAKKIGYQLLLDGASSRKHFLPPLRHLSARLQRGDGAGLRG